MGHEHGTASSPAPPHDPWRGPWLGMFLVLIERARQSNCFVVTLAKRWSQRTVAWQTPWSCLSGVRKAFCQANLPADHTVVAPDLEAMKPGLLSTEQLLLWA